MKEGAMPEHRQLTACWVQGLGREEVTVPRHSAAAPVPLCLSLFRHIFSLALVGVRIEVVF